VAQSFEIWRCFKSLRHFVPGCYEPHSEHFRRLTFATLAYQLFRLKFGLPIF
jgi:hypothetical protein